MIFSALKNTSPPPPAIPTAVWYFQDPEATDKRNLILNKRGSSQPAFFLKDADDLPRAFDPRLFGVRGGQANMNAQKIRVRVHLHPQEAGLRARIENRIVGRQMPYMCSIEGRKSLPWSCACNCCICSAPSRSRHGRRRGRAATTACPSTTTSGATSTAWTPTSACR